MKKLQNLWERQAKKQMSLHPTAKEYSPLLVLVTVGKLLTMCTSIAGGILYFLGIFGGIYLPLVVLLSASLLLLLEGLNMFSLSKSLKMGLRGQPLPSIILAVFSLVLFAASFFITTEGVKQWKAKRTSRKGEISANYKNERQNIRQEYAKRINHLQNTVEPLLRFAWKSAQVERYNSKIDSLQLVMANKINAIDQKERESKAIDEKHTNSKADQFWLIGVILMAAQLLFNVVIAILYNRIHRETEQTQRIDEELNILRETRLQNFYTQVRADFAGLENLFLQRLAITGGTELLAISPKAELESTDSPVEELKNTQESESTKEIPTQRTIGFQIPSTNGSRIDASRNNETRIDETRYTKPNNKEPTENEKVKYTRICPCCGKGFIHKHHMQKYCSTDCRIEFWEQKTGKKLKKHKKK